MTKQQINMLLAMVEGYKYVWMSLNSDQVFVSYCEDEMYDHNPCEKINHAWDLIKEFNIKLNHKADDVLVDAMKQVLKKVKVEIPTHTSVKLVRGKYVPRPTAEGYSRDIEPNEFEV